MKLFLYYAVCSVKNQIKKLFRSWVAAFFAICLLLGVVLGVGISVLDGFLAEDIPPEEDESVEAPLPDAEEEVEAFVDPETAGAIAELAVAGIVAAVLFVSVFSADKSGSSIFLMADVNLLFSAPMKPQSVLLFRLMSQIFLTLFASVYIVFQLPNLVVNLGIDALTAVAFILVWVIVLVFGKLLSVLVYTVASTYPSFKKWIRPALYGILFLTAGGFYLYHVLHPGHTLFSSANAFFNGTASRWIPIYGWLKGLAAYTMEGKLLQAGVSLLLLIGGIVILAVLVWRIKADFYEDAMAKSQETAERMAAMQSGASVNKRKKDRSERVRRDGFRFGSGAEMFFWKTVYNRFRFATWKIFTKTSVFYLVLSVGISLISVLFADTSLFFVVGLVLCGAVFFRALGNPLAVDVGKDCFVTVPASPYAKVIWSLLGGTVDCTLDLLPALAVAALMHGASPIEAAGYLFLAIGVDFYVSNIMLFIELSLPSSLALQIKQAIGILFIYFGLMPIAAVVLVGWALKLYVPFLFIGAVVATVIGGVFYAFSPLFLLRGRK